MSVKLAAWVAGISLLVVIGYEAATARDPRAAGLRSRVTNV